MLYNYQIIVTQTESAPLIICSDKSLDDVLDQTFDAVILPGGAGGAKAMAESDKVKKLVDF